MARVCREFPVLPVEQDEAIDDPGDVEDDDRRNGEERSKSQDHFLGKPEDSKLEKNKPDQEGKEAVEEQPEGHLLVASPLHEGEDGGRQEAADVEDFLALFIHQEAAEAAAQHDSLEDKGRVVYL